MNQLKIATSKFFAACIVAFVLLFSPVHATESEPETINDRECFLIIVHNNNGQRVSFSSHPCDTIGYLQRPNAGSNEYFVYTNAKYIKFCCDSITEKPVYLRDNLNSNSERLDSYNVTFSNDSCCVVKLSDNGGICLGQKIKENNCDCTITGLYFETKEKKLNRIVLNDSILARDASPYSFVIKRGNSNNKYKIKNVCLDNNSINKYNKDKDDKPIKIDSVIKNIRINISSELVNTEANSAGFISSILVNGTELNSSKYSQYSQTFIDISNDNYFKIGRKNIITIKYKVFNKAKGNPATEYTDEYHFVYRPYLHYVIVALVVIIFLVVIFIILLKRNKSKEGIKETNIPDNTPKISYAEDSSSNPDKENNAHTQSSSEKQTFKNFSDKDVLNRISEFIGDTDTKDFQSDFSTALRKVGTKFAIDTWNNYSNGCDIYKSDNNMERFITHIMTGYIGNKEKDYIESLKKQYNPNAGSLDEIRKNISNEAYREGYKEGQQYIANEVESIIPRLQELGFDIDIKAGISPEQLIEILSSSVRQGINGNKLVESLEAENKKVSDLEDMVNELLAEKENLQENIKQYIAEIESKNAEIKSQNETFVSLTGVVNDLYMTIECQKTEIAQKDETITLRDNVIEEQQKNIRLQNEKIESLDTEINKNRILVSERLSNDISDISDQINRILTSVEGISHDNRKYVNVMKKIADNFGKFHEIFRSSLSRLSEEPTKTADNIISVIVELVKPGLEPCGWINIISYLNLYIGCTPELNISFEINGIKSAEFARLTSTVHKFLGYIGITIYLPHLLVEKYNSDYYDFENADQWIQSFASNLVPNEFSGKIFDMSQIGYQIKDEINKPKVFTC